jgi:hypothetical protein
MACGVPGVHTTRLFLYSEVLQGEGGAHVRPSVADTTCVTQFDKKANCTKVVRTKVINAGDGVPGRAFLLAPGR